MYFFKIPEIFTIVLPVILYSYTYIDYNDSLVSYLQYSN